MGARASGMAYASSCLSDEWSVFNNIAGLAFVRSPISSFTCDVQPAFKPFNKAAAVFVNPLKPGVAGVGLYRFGDDLYNEQIITAGFSNHFGLAALGLKLNYIQYNAKGFGRKGVFTVSFGGIAELTSQLFIGAHIININQPKLSSAFNEKIPTILVAGILFKPTDHTFITTELEKDLEYKPTWKTGVEHKIHKKFLCRTGFAVYPASGFLGVGFKSKKFSLDYTYQYVPELGARHQGSVSYQFNDPEKE
ncbi:MAG: hypothetical protein C0490_05145 [Marivirga sp.]|nr:hypothetical protein [Marivirga sp.]